MIEKHFNMLIWCSKTFLIIINVEKSCAALYFGENHDTFFLHLLRTAFILFINTAFFHLFYVTFDQFNAFLLNISLNFLKNIYQ